MRTESPASRAGRLDGVVDGTLDDLRGARGAFMRRRELTEAEWPAYRAAYDAAVAAEARRRYS